MKKSNIIYILILLLLIGVFCFSAWQVGSYFLESRKQQDAFDNLAALVESAKNAATDASQSSQATTGGAQETVPGETEGNTGPTILPEYAALYAMNQDLVGWISIADTKINYPVMQTPDSPDFYLHRNFSKEPSSQGCIYVRESCDVNAPSDNVTIYGHHMKDGSMFAGLMKYEKKSYWEEHDIIVFDTLTEHHTYRIFAVFKTTASVGEGFAYHQFENAESKGTFDAFISKCKKLSLYDTGITPEYGDKIICLSTCEYTQTNGRFVIAAVRVS